MQILKTLLEQINDEKLHPIAYYFDAVEKDFVENVNWLTKGEGSAFEGIISCTFPRQLDEYEVYNHGFNGIIFDYFEDEIVVDVQTFRKYLRMACEAYWQEHPESKPILEEYLARPQPPLEDGASEEWIRRRDAGKYPKPYSEFE